MRKKSPEIINVSVGALEGLKSRITLGVLLESEKREKTELELDLSTLESLNTQQKSLDALQVTSMEIPTKK